MEPKFLCGVTSEMPKAERVRSAVRNEPYGNKPAKASATNKALAWANVMNNSGNNFSKALQKFGNDGISFGTRGTSQITPIIAGRPVGAPALKAMYQKFVLDKKVPGALTMKNWSAQLLAAQDKFKRNLAAGTAKIGGNKWNASKVIVALGQNQDWKKYFNTNVQLRSALNKTLSKNVSLVPMGVFRPPTQNPNINIQTARSIVAVARLNREASHYTGPYLQSHLGDYLETVSFTVGAEASGAFPVYWSSKSGSPSYGLNSNRNWSSVSQYFDPSWPYDTTVILESEVPFENTIKQFPVNTTNTNKKLFVDILKRESEPVSQVNSRGQLRPMTNWTALRNSPYKGWNFGKPDAVIIRRKGPGQYMLMILELKIGIGKPEPVPAEMFQLLKIMRSMEILVEPIRRRGINIEIKGYFVPWFYGVLQKTRPAFTTIDTSIVGDFLGTYLNFIKSNPSYKIDVVSDATSFKNTFGLNTDVITSTLNQFSAQWFQTQGEIMNRLVRSGRIFGSLSQENLEMARNASKTVLLRMNKTNRNYGPISNFLKRTQGVVVPSARPGKSSRLAYLQHPEIVSLGQWAPPRAEAIKRRAVIKAARKLGARGIRTSVPVLSKQTAGNSNTNVSENEANIIAQAVKDTRFIVYVTAQNVNRYVNSANSIRSLESVLKILGAVPGVNANSKRQLEQKIYMKQATIAANMARLRPGNSLLINQARRYAQKAGVAIQQPSQMEANLEAQLRALQQGR